VPQLAQEAGCAGVRVRPCNEASCYRAAADLVLLIVDCFGERLRAAVEAAKTPVERTIPGASPINWIETTAVERLDELRRHRAVRRVVFGIARAGSG
jgi:hypothetical protein